MDILICDPVSEKALQYFRKRGFSVTYRPSITEAELLREIGDYQAVLVRSRTKITATVIAKAKTLKVIARIGSGFDNIDIKKARNRKIVVVNAPDANSQAVSELTLWMMLTLLRGGYRAVRSMAGGKWLKNDLWGSELAGKQVGVVGFGHIGRKVVDLLKAFGAEVLIYDRKHQTCSLEDLFRKSDIITLHLALNESTEGLIGSLLLNSMKKNAFLINMSRGPIVDEEALYQVLFSKKIAGAALDVYWQEPLPPDSKWRKLPNLIATPHIGAATNEALEKASITAADDIVKVLDGFKPDNPV
ncbi:MAG: D-3-phosphoglycerate dehydrogenase, D-3-phosphoglycerate dehydrogenase [Candidatus Gottesmanbacteria bacterium GW2011_GWA2_43_14]|uniref:D-3-phosphoglycerate dehydrogenase, D-3-phosphoglycerate dehydrogenase n=1 Tax=Candidatus Gottesmanbacteria bacterium GW2011_GWA2_43_14 TaxID=1618443 RepID=A0A0G1FR99_9BACT|nr:MAG: D-3-phosphoglycerate dehydrogenase, D-3-phosphoglycerate dehydrogenase [Candidatus Gottesmanbacteria bacterium GW2011_GWA2_43_14]